MENEDNMMEENQNIIQPEEVEENPVAEVVTDDEPATAEVEPSQPDTTEEEPVPEWRRKLTECWNKTVEFVKSHKRLVIYVLCAIVVLLAVLFVVERNKNSRNRYESLGQTITEMKKISEFCTANYIGEVMIQDEEKHLLKKKNIVLIVRGKVRMGYDLTKMETEVVNDSVINLTLPSAQILDIITNPSDIRTFSEKGNWSHDRVTITKNAARAKLLELVMEENMLATAEENGKRQLSAIFSSFGFKHVNIDFVVDTTGSEIPLVAGDSVSENATILFAN